MKRKRVGSCSVCRRRPVEGSLMCAQCGRSYDESAFRDCSVAGAIEWAANRARRFSGSPTAREEAAVVMAAERLVGKRWDSSWKSEAQKVCNAVARLQAARKRATK